jgi:hypothetical protein
LRPLFGYISDTAWRPVGGAEVEIVTGPNAGLGTVSDATGLFAFEQDIATPATVQVRKDGYAIGSGTSIVLSDGRAWISLALDALTPPVAIAGSYTLTITADRTCAALPDEARTRSYPSTVTPSVVTGVSANTRFDGRTTGGQFAPYGNVFWIGVFGDYLTISTEGEGPSLVEHLGSNRYVAFYGAAGASVGRDSVSTISAPYAGVIEYCELSAPIGAWYDCSPSLAAVRHECRSSGHTLTLARR